MKVAIETKMEYNEKYELETTLVVSTAHITQVDFDLLDVHTIAEDPEDIIPNLIADRFPYGYNVNITEDMKEEIETYRDKFSKGFIQSLELGIKIGVTWVKFDQDAMVYAELPKYEW